VLAATTPAEGARKDGSSAAQWAQPAQRPMRVVWRAALCLLGLQLIGMFVLSTLQYGRFNLGNDFADYAQAWTAIAHGHLNPTISFWGFSFWRDDLELLMWPLAVFYWVYPHTLTLLYLQDIAVVAGELVVIVWAKEIITKSKQARYNGAWVFGSVIALLVITPWSWLTIGFDFHFEPFAVLFALLAARDLWAGRYLWLIVWVPLTLASCAAAGSLLVIAIGLAAILSRDRSRPVAAAVVLAGLGWLAMASALGGMLFGGLQLSTMYGYLSGHTTGHLSLFTSLVGFVTNPLAALRMFSSHAAFVAGYIASAGVVGLLSRWALFPALVILLPGAFNANVNFIHFAQSFQNWPAVLFLVVGFALACGLLAEKVTVPRGAVPAFGAWALAVALIVGVPYLGHISSYVDGVSPGAARLLAQVQRQIPPGGEVVASQGVVGRFSADRSAFDYWAHGTPEKYPLTGQRVVFVLSPAQGTAEGVPQETRSAISYVRERLHATLLEQGSGVWVFAWAPRPGTRSVVLP
jgi:Predicted membrane protein (DUF2079)